MSNAEKTARSYMAAVESAVNRVQARMPCVTVPLMLAIIDKRSGWGWDETYYPKGNPAGRCQHRRGCGFYEFDKHQHRGFIQSGRWSDVEEATVYYCECVLQIHRVALAWHIKDDEALMSAMLAATDAGTISVINRVVRGENPDTATVGDNYSADVLDRAKRWSQWYSKSKEEYDGKL